MTNHWIDIRNADVILVMGSNAAENHPISFTWVTEAKQKGAKLISVDPRFTRTSAKADVYAPLRSGTDIAFLNGMMNYMFQNKLYDEFYVKHYTNAPFLVDPAFRLPGESGVFSGYEPEARKYDKSTWAFQKDEQGVIKKDMSMEDPQCVFQLLKKHVSRYNLDIVSSVTGTPKEKLVEVYNLYASSAVPTKKATILYAMGWTQHTVGTQIIRAMSIIQLLLGNMGVAGGGVNALRGESNVQGSTDHCLLFHILPGYLKTPRASDTTLEAYNKRYTPTTDEPHSLDWWKNYPKYSVSLLKAHFGDAATGDNEFGYQWLPKLDDGQNASWIMLFHQMFKGQFDGFFAWGQNPACSGTNANKTREALAKLKWMVNVNLFDNETGSFWRGPDVNPDDVQTEVFQLPAALSVEKEGSITNSGRWAQWRYKAVDPPGEAKRDSWIMNELYYRVKTLYEKQGGAYPDPVVKLAWHYGQKNNEGKILDIDAHAIAREINGYYLEGPNKGKLVANFTKLAQDGSTSSGNWLYSGSYNEGGNMMARRSQSDPSGMGLYPEWSWCWPVNRRVIYNRCSVDLEGKPRDPKRPVIYWNGTKWVGDVPDGGAPPMGQGGYKPFIMKPAGVGHIFGPGLHDGPFPEHYEPLECPVQENAMNKQRINPAAKLFVDVTTKEVAIAGTGLPEDYFATCDVRYPFVGTTYRVTEHWQTGVVTRHEPWQLEMQPQNFVEMSVELAKELGIRKGEEVIVESARGSVHAIAIVTHRFRPYNIQNSTVHEVGLPWCFGWEYPPPERQAFDSSNLLTPTIGDANTMIPETKAFMVNVKKLKGGE
jgi:formate dehydrogenase major subunit